MYSGSVAPCQIFVIFAKNYFEKTFSHKKMFIFEKFYFNWQFLENQEKNFSKKLFPRWWKNTNPASGKLLSPNISELDTSALQQIPNFLPHNASILGIRSIKLFVTRTLAHTLTSFLDLIIDMETLFMAYTCEQVLVHLQCFRKRWQKYVFSSNLCISVLQKLFTAMSPFQSKSSYKNLCLQ